VVAGKSQWRHRWKVERSMKVMIWLIGANDERMVIDMTLKYSDLRTTVDPWMGTPARGGARPERDDQTVRNGLGSKRKKANNKKEIEETTALGEEKESIPLLRINKKILLDYYYYYYFNKNHTLRMRVNLLLWHILQLFL